jgi:hypothetical protein
VQEKVLSNYYDKYVKPGYEGNAFPAPDKATWVKGIRIAKESGFTAGDYYDNTVAQNFLRGTAGAAKGGLNIFTGLLHTGVSMDKTAGMALLGIDRFFSDRKHNLDGELKIEHLDAIKKLGEEQAKEANKRIDEANWNMQLSSNFFLAIHPSNTYVGKMSSSIGELVAQLPFYEAIGAVRLGAMAKGAPVLGKAASMAEAVGSRLSSSRIPMPEMLKTAADKIASTSIYEAAKTGTANLTEMLASTARGKIVATSLHAAGDGYLSGLAMDHGIKGSGEDAKNYAEFAGELGMGGKVLAGAGGWFARKFISKVAAEGGRPLVQAIFDEAHNDLTNGGANDGSLVLGKNANGEEVSLHPKNEAEGHLQIGDKRIRYANAEQRQNMVSAAIRHISEEDPVRHKLVQSAKIILQDHAKELGPMQAKTLGYHELGPMQLATLNVKLGAEVERAIQEFPLHNPEKAKALAAQGLEEDTKSNPALAQRVAEFEKKYKIKVSDEMHEHEVETTKINTGNKSAQGVMRKVKQSLAKAPKDDEAPRSYVSFKAATAAYFKNPAGQRAASPNFNYKDWLADMDSDDFISELKAHSGIKTSTESPKNMLIWAWGHSKNMPPEFAERIQEELHDLNNDPKVKKYDKVGNSPGEWDKQFKNMEYHMQKLANTNALKRKNTIYATSNYGGWDIRSDWMLELTQDQENQEAAKFAKLTKNYPAAADGMSMMLKALQTERRNAVNGLEDKRATSKINKLFGSF